METDAWVDGSGTEAPRASLRAMPEKSGANDAYETSMTRCATCRGTGRGAHSCVISDTGGWVSSPRVSQGGRDVRELRVNTRHTANNNARLQECCNPGHPSVV